MERFSVKMLVEERGGSKAFAQSFGVTQQCVNNWVRGVAVPRTKALMKLIDWSQGRLTLDGIVAETMRNARTTDEDRENAQLQLELSGTPVEGEGGLDESQN